MYMYRRARGDWFFGKPDGQVNWAAAAAGGSRCAQDVAARRGRFRRTALSGRRENAVLDGLERPSYSRRGRVYVAKARRKVS